MKKPKIVMKVTKEEIGYSAQTKIGNKFIATEGDNFEELKKNILEAVHLAFEDESFTFSSEEIKFEMDVSSFFEFYKVINAKALSDRIGMSQSLLAQYIKGIKKPSSAQLQRILNGVQQIGKELVEIRFMM